MHVLRLQNSEGIGPFASASVKASEFVQHVPWSHLTPNGKGLVPDETHPHHLTDVEGALDTLDPIMRMLGMEYSEKWRTGVKDTQQLLHWFPPSSLPFFKSKGFKVAEYEVPPTGVKAGSFQVIFDTDKAKLVREEDPTTLVKESDNDRS